MSARIDALGMDVDFERGEEMRTEISCKFTRDSLAREYAAAGLELLALVHGRRRPVRAVADRARRRRRPTDPGAPLPRAAAPSTAERGLRRARPVERAPPGRPYTVANMVATADGRATLDGRTQGDLQRDRPRAVPQPAHAGRRGDGRHRHDRARALRPARAPPGGRAAAARSWASPRCRSRSRPAARWSCRWTRRCSRTRSRGSSC